MSAPRIERPDLPEYMTWEELERLPDEIAGQIELWEGRVVWLRRGPAEHQAFTFGLTAGLKRCARTSSTGQPEQCWRADFETNVFFGLTGKSDYVTPDFVVYRCLDSPYQDLRAVDVLLVGEVLSPSNKQTDIDAKKAKYGKAGIPWYWEVDLQPQQSAIATIRAFALEKSSPDLLPAGVRTLYPANYALVDKWTPTSSDAIEINSPFPIHIPWTDLEF
ncbi:Uma2 family endonuclease [Nocardia goodfellowii]|uniref:Uma2 family endonuclease n=1 Tax=Nocardia goodfellowii TaxID=882446 RepID=A0ABS4Q6W2_9NOCA|nr:Uma2 family endonuclease [Nocardia goodfellowii]MBP2187435.1 Uma2 family endonuclease [Nocardia goodfellowii]